MMRVLIADDHSIVREGVKSILANVPDVIVAAEARNGKEVLEAIITSARQALAKAGMTVRQTVFASYAATLFLGGMALWVMYASPLHTLGVLTGTLLLVLAIAVKLGRYQMPSNRQIFTEGDSDKD